MKNKDKMIQSAALAFLTIATASSVQAATADATQNEKCYGIVRAGMNDCATATQSCSGSSVKDNQADAYLVLPKGTCKKIVGGRLKPDADKG